ncbi:MAG TPA: single-stranded-DNA-specific exonuclease RecJ [Casimicrobiaceae bacterium]|nr:single-stranded-DNA-specific exonuclease RecJ [Casimicrobiaceae bacterium]
MTIVRREPIAPTAPLQAAGWPPVLARIYAARGVRDAAELDHSLAALPSFAAFANIDAAAERLARAIAARERVVIIADYDADGATACAVGVLGLTAMGANVGFLVPNRFEFGYGLTPEIVAIAAAEHPDVIVTVDNGIASVDGVAAAAAAGIDVIITDHHLPGAALPQPAIIVNPNQVGCAFPSKHVAGVGVMFYVLCALRARLRAAGAFGAGAGPNLAELLDLVALGTVADVVRLDHVNRILVEQGLARIRNGRGRPGIVALFAVAGRDIARASASDLGFVTGPRLNAAGRLADMSLGIQCLLADSERTAEPLARELDRLNRDRRDIEATMQDEALADVENGTFGENGAYTLCVHRPEWHQGVIGIVASRLKDRYHRPVIVFARGNGDELKGSGRSIAGFHLRDALDVVAKRAPGVVLRFGGHAFAAGLSIHPDRLPDFIAAFEAIAREMLTEAQLRRVHESDGALARGELTVELGTTISGCVWGQGFPPPAFDDTFDVIAQRVVGDGHAKLTVARDGERFNAIAFRTRDALPPRIRALFRPEVNHWNGLTSLELVIDFWVPA